MSNGTQRLSGCCLATVCAVTLFSSVAQADPKIHSVSPPGGPLMSFATIHGEDFGEAQGRNYVKYGDRLITVINWTDAAITVLMNPMSFSRSPMALDTYYPMQVVKLKTDSNNPGGPDNPLGTAVDKRSNTMNCLLTSGTPPPYHTGGGIDLQPSAVSQDEPILESLQGRTFHAGDLLTVNGRQLGTGEGRGFVSISVPFRDTAGVLFHAEYAVPAIAWNATQVQARLTFPPGAEMGTYTVTVHHDNGKTASTSFNVVGP